MDNLLYTDDHDWIKTEGSRVYVGITDFAQKSLGDIVYVELPEPGAALIRGKVFSSVESVKAVADIKAPISGKVLEINETLNDDPQLLNEDPYINWIAVIEPSNPNEYEGLMNEAAYKEFCERK